MKFKKQKIDNLNFFKRKSIYEEMFKQAAKLEDGEGFEVPCPEGVDIKVFNNRISTAFAKFEHPKGFRIRKQYNRTRTGMIISCRDY